jgi:hypothetical protein
MKHIIVLLVCVLFGGLPASAERGILGAQSYDSPLGCAPDSVFNLVAGTTLNTFASAATTPSTAHSFNILANYNSGQGAAFQTMITTTSNIIISTAGLRPSSFFGSLQYSTANNPDVTNTIGTVSIQSADSIFLHGTRVTAPCNATNCLHNWIFDTTGAGPGVDTDFTIGSANAGQGTLGGVSDGTNLYFLHRLVTPVNTTMLWVFDQAATTTVNFANVGNIVTREMVQSSDSVYFVNSAGGAVSRATKSALTLTSFPIAFGTLSDNIAYSTSQGAFYLATISGGPTLTIRRYNSNFSSNTHNLVIGNETPSPFGLMMDERAQKLYLVTELPGFKRIRRINPATLASEQTLSIATGTTGFVAAPDFNYRNLWISDVGNPSHIQRVQLCT